MIFACLQMFLLSAVAQVSNNNNPDSIVGDGKERRIYAHA